MKASLGLLMLGACALALPGCTTSDIAKALFSGNANAIIASSTMAGGNVQTVSDADKDPTTKADIAYDRGSAPGWADDSVTVSIENGGAVAGPAKYANGVGLSGGGAYGVFTPDATSATPGPDDSILVAAIGKNGADETVAYSGFVASNMSAADGPAYIAAGYGGVAPTTLPTTGTLIYEGNAAAVTQSIGGAGALAGGTASITADFDRNRVNGAFNFTGSTYDVTFAGQMSTSDAAYASDSVTLGGTAGAGTVQGGFYGDTGQNTAGLFDVQSANGQNKVVGAFNAAVP